MGLDPRWREVQRALQAAAGSANELVPALATLVDSDAWREFTHPMRGVLVFDSFGKFCDDILKIKPDAIEALLAKSDAKAAAEKVRKMIREDIAPIAKHGEIGGGHLKPETRPDIIRSDSFGTDPSYIVARLKRDDPDLAQEVVEGRMSAHAAAIKAGIKKPTATYRTDDIHAALRSWLKHYTPIEIQGALAVREVDV